MTTNSYTLTLRKIASWQVDGITTEAEECSGIVAGLPSLQRGAAWNAQQIEIFWDSICRGFPVGSIILANKIESQSTKTDQVRATITTDRSSEKLKHLTHHILDGQQRCNAIAWGFADPQNENTNKDSVLWLDLNPENKSLGTTRKYLFRLTNKAHPWGFDTGDESGILGISDRRKFMDKVYGRIEQCVLQAVAVERHSDVKADVRPLPGTVPPFKAVFPVPVFLLFKHFSNNKIDWNHLAREDWFKKAELWRGKGAAAWLNDEKVTGNIETAMRMLLDTKIVALVVPEVLKNIDDLEKIFSRLNTQGTPIDREELVYSLIKAYWPEIESVIDRILNLPITAVRLVNLGVRVALTPEGATKLAPELTVKEIRGIFSTTDVDAADGIEKLLKTQKKLIKEYFEKPEGLLSSLTWIDDNLLYCKTNRSYGIPAYIRSSLAWRSREVFAWLMLLARQRKSQALIDSRKVLGLALAIHWFGIDKAMAVDKLIRLSGRVDITLSDLNRNEHKKLVLIPLDLGDFDAAFQLDESSVAEQLRRWSNFWNGVVAYDKSGTRVSDDKATRRMDQYGEFIEKLKSEHELLVYVQREEMVTIFQGFDPANKLMWKGHNRPWDYDHILPSNDLDGRKFKTADFIEVCKAWQQSIGNLAAIDFASNRRFQDNVVASSKYASDPHVTDAFDLKGDQTGDIEAVKKFILAAKKRLIAIYGDWYLGLEVGEITRPFTAVEGSATPNSLISAAV